MQNIFVFIIFLLFFVCSHSFSQEAISLEDKIAQILMISVDNSQISKAIACIRSGIGGIQLQWGSYSLEDTQKITDSLQSLAKKEGPLKIPLFIAVDYEGGSVYSPTTLGLLELPTNMMLGAANDTNTTASLFYLAGTELKKAGINTVFGPVLDVNTNPQNPIIGVRSISDNPELVTSVGIAIINGFKAAGILTVPKHFPGHGATSLDSHKTLPVVRISNKEFQEIHLKPFATAINAGIPGIMTAHVLYPHLDLKFPATLSEKIIFKLLKKELKFNGIVITDSLDMAAITKKQNISQSAVQALKSGADILLLGKDDFDKTKNAIFLSIKNGYLNETRLNDAFYKIIQAKKSLGIFNEKETTSEFDRAYLQISEELAQKSVTLIRDEQKILPLSLLPPSKVGNIVIVLFAPPRFNEHTICLYKTFVEKGFNAIQYTLDINPSQTNLKKILKDSHNADILIIGSFQWANLPNKDQIRAIKQLVALKKPVILLSMMSPYDIENYPEVKTILTTYGITKPSIETAAKIIMGEIIPQGKLPVKIKQ